MPRFRLSRNQNNLKDPEKIPLRVIVHESGRKSVVRSGFNIRVFNAQDEEDLPVEEHAIGKFSQKEAEVIMQDPSKINIKKMSKKLLKNYKRSGRQ